MPNFLPGHLIKETRARKKWRQSALLYHIPTEDAYLSRIENTHHSPRHYAFLNFMDELEMPVETFFSPYLIDQPMEVIIIRERIMDLLDYDEPQNWQQAEELVQGLKRREGFEIEVNRQFILSCTAQLNELRQLDPVANMTLAKEGIALTYDKFNEETFEGDLLLFEESNLLHTLAQSYYRMGKVADSIALLYRIEKGISRLPEDDHEKEKKLAPVLLTLSNYLIQEKKFDEARKVCEKGNAASIKRNKGRYTPDFMYNIAVCSYFTDNADDCRKFLQYSFFGYALLRKMKQAKRVKKDAKERFGIEFDTYGVEDLVFEEYDTTIGHGASVKCDSINSFITALRHEAGAAPKQLFEGICSQGTYSKIENSDESPNVFFLEGIFQRLGRDIHKYLFTFPDVDDYFNIQTRDEINSRLANDQYELAAELLPELKTKKRFKDKKGICAQFIKNAEASIFASRNGSGHPEYLEMLKVAMDATRPKFDERKADTYRLGYYELMIANQMAIYYCETGDLPRGLKLFDRLRDGMNDYHVDEREKVRMYPTILYNYSKYLGWASRRQEAIQMVKEGEEMGLRHKRLTLLPRFAINKAYGLQELGQKKESVPFWALAYYGSKLLGDKVNAPIVANYVREHLGIVFD